MGEGTRKFVWHDLQTPDPAAAESFYSGLFGWEFERHESLGPYLMIRCGDQSLGGIMQSPAPSIPPHWIGYVSVDDVDETVAKAAATGGNTIVPGTDIPGIGRFGIFLDPEGAPLAVYSSDRPGEAPPEGMPPPGSFTWDEWNGRDVGRAKEYFAGLFGWSYQPFGDEYSLIQVGGCGIGGLSTLPADAPHPPHWVPYIAVADVEANTARVGELGGTNLIPPTAIPNVGRFALNLDPQGALFATIQLG